MATAEMSRKRKTAEASRANVNARIDLELWRRFKSLAALSGEPVGQRIERLVRQDVEQAPARNAG